MSLISGAHSIIYSTNPDADRVFFRDILKFTNVDAGEGWLIFGLPDSEFAIHPSVENDVHEFYLLCDDVNAFTQEMKKRNIECSPVQSLGWGMLTKLALPGGGKIGIYQPRHKRPKPTPANTKKKIKSKAISKTKRKSVLKKSAKKKSKRK